MTVRTTTERPVTITHGTNRLATWEGLAIAVDEALARRGQVVDGSPLWDGRAAGRVASSLRRWLETWTGGR